MRGLAQRDIAHDLERKPFKSCDFGGMIRQQLYTTEAKVMKYLRAHSVIAVDAVACFEARFTLAHGFLLHHRVSAQLIYQIKTVLTLAQVKNHALTGGGDFFQSSMELKPGVVDQGAKHIAGNVLCMHANQDRVLSFNVAHNHSQMDVSVDDVFVSNSTKAPINCREIRLYRASHQRLFVYTVPDEVSNSNHF